MFRFINISQNELYLYLIGDIRAMGGKILLNYKVDKFSETTENSEYPVTIRSSDSDTKLLTKYVLTCAGSI